MKFLKTDRREEGLNLGLHLEGNIVIRRIHRCHGIDRLIDPSLRGVLVNHPNQLIGGICPGRDLIGQGPIRLRQLAGNQCEAGSSDDHHESQDPQPGRIHLSFSQPFPKLAHEPFSSNSA